MQNDTVIQNLASRVQLSAIYLLCDTQNYILNFVNEHYYVIFQILSSLSNKTIEFFLKCLSGGILFSFSVNALDLTRCFP